jgi:preprotein translocase subunit SecA
MFVDLMNDIYNTFSERFLKVQLIVEPPPPPPPPILGGGGGPRGGPTKRYNALGILEDVPAEEAVGLDNGGAVAVEDVGPAEIPATKPAQARKDPVIVGAGRPRSLSSSPAPANVDWSTVGRNDPCPCGSGKKFKKCHGAQL